MILANGNPNSSLWAITSYFNPARYRRRRANYQAFRKNLGAPLITVEVANGGGFELQRKDADILLQLHVQDMLWQKERLLNVALNALPDDCLEVAWVDCDVVFAANDWAARCQRALQTYPLVQLFSRVLHLPPELNGGGYHQVQPLFGQSSLGHALRSGFSVQDHFEGSMERSARSYSGGFAWAARRELLEHHGFYDACIIGGGDKALNAAALGLFDAVIRQHGMNEHQQRRYRGWAERFHDTVRGAIGCTEGVLYHLWHGDMAKRRTRERHEGLAAFQFDPFSDIAIASNGCWRWNSEKRALHEYVSGYFVARQEDG